MNSTVLSDPDAAYIAGLIDGEGCIGYYKHGVYNGTLYHSATIHISMTDSRPLLWLTSVVNCGNISVVNYRGNRRTVYSWQLCNRAKVKELLTTIYPYLKVKGNQVGLLIDLWKIEDNLPKGSGSVTPELIAIRQYTADRIKQLKTVQVEGVETRRAEPILG